MGNKEHVEENTYLSPRIADVPVLRVGLRISAPADDRDDVINLLAWIRDNSGGVLEQRLCVDSACNGSTGVDLFLHGIASRDGSVIGKPTPKNDRDASSVIAKAKFIVDITMRGGRQFGNK